MGAPEPFFYLRVKDGREFLRLVEVQGSDPVLLNVPERERASVFCSHTAPAVRDEAERITGQRYRMVLAWWDTPEAVMSRDTIWQ